MLLLQQVETEQSEENLVTTETVVAEVSKGSAVTFEVNSSRNIPSDGAPHKMTIFNDDFPAHSWQFKITLLLSIRNHAEL